MDWIDAHVHIGEDTAGASATAEEVVQLLDEGPLDRAVVFCFDETRGLLHGNDHVWDVAQDDDRLAPLLRVDPAMHDPEDLSAASDDYAGFKFHPRSQDFPMQAVYEHLEVIGATGKPALIHTGLDEGRAHPRAVLEAAEIHPDTDIVMAHATKGYYFQNEGFRERLARCDNVYLDTSLHMTPLGIETMVEDLGADRILFASDYPYGHPVPMQKNVELATIPQHAAEDIAAGNAERLFF